MRHEAAEPGSKSADAPVAAPQDPARAAQEAGLRYVSDRQPGLRRRGAAGRWEYVGPDGRPVEDERTLARIRKLAIPPAWTDVWICPIAHGHLQATGRDARGRKQYRYHPSWTARRNETKFGRAAAFAEALPELRRRIDGDLRQRGLPRTKVLAAVIQLLQDTLIRIGNSEYVLQNDSYGLTTLRDKHVEIEGATLRFRFRGKSGKVQALQLADRRLARIVKSCRDLPGAELFQYVDDEGGVQCLGSGDVNAYLREVTGREFTAKDFRTWGGTVLAAQVLHRLGRCSSDAETKKNVVQCVKRVSERLGNTPAVCRRYYVNPTIVEAYADGTLLQAMEAALRRPQAAPQELTVAERAVLAVLRRARKDAARAA